MGWAHPAERSSLYREAGSGYVHMDSRLIPCRLRVRFSGRGARDHVSALAASTGRFSFGNGGGGLSVASRDMRAAHTF